MNYIFAYFVILGFLTAMVGAAALMSAGVWWLGIPLFAAVVVAGIAALERAR